jgi:MtaA/CmuA family methyltransferase
MNSFERVQQLVKGNPVDHLPAQPMLMMFAAKHIGIPYLEYTVDHRKMARAQISMYEDFGVDCLLTCSDPAREVMDIAGDGSVDWFPDQGPAINESRAALLDKTRLLTFKIPDPLGGGRMHDRVKGIELMRQRVKQDVSIVGWVEGPLALAAELRGLSTLMMDFIDDPDFVKDLLAFCADVAIAYAPAQIAAGADTIGMSDAAASMIGPHLYAQFVLPEQQRVLRAIRRNHPAILTRVHMCGLTDPLFGNMKHLGADICELDFPVNLELSRRELGADQVICGNVSTITDLLEGTPEKVYQATQRCHQICGKRHIVGAGCEVSPNTPPDNLRAMLEYARHHRPDA